MNEREIKDRYNEVAEGNKCEGGIGTSQALKRIDTKFLLIQAAILCGVSWIIGIVISVVTGGKAPIIEGFRVMPMFLFFAVLIYGAAGNLFTGTIAKKTMEENAKKENFGKSSTFVTAGSFTIGAIVMIDENTGRVAYVSYWNPYEFQMVQAKDLTNIKSDYIKAPLGGTQYVYFEFYYKNKRVRIPTFTASNVYSLQSSEVLEGISKADTFCDLLKQAQKG